MAVARRILGDRDRAEEAVSEAFAKTLRALVSGRGPTDSFKSYILAAVRGEAYRRPAIERLVDDVTDGALAQLPDARHGDPGASLSERDQVVRAFSTLRARWRDVLYLLEVEGVSVATAARETGTNSAAVVSLAVLGAGLLAFAVLNPLARLAAPEVPGQQHVQSPTVAATGGGAPGEEPPSPSNPGGR